MATTDVTGSAGFKDSHERERNLKPFNLGINSDGIHHEVALKILGQELQPFVSIIHKEQAKALPSAALIQYCERRIAAIVELQGALQVEDRSTIERILDPEDGLFRWRPEQG